MAHYEQNEVITTVALLTIDSKFGGIPVKSLVNLLKSTFLRIKERMWIASKNPNDMRLVSGCTKSKMK